jgi:hypothetical protein
MSKVQNSIAYLGLASIIVFFPNISFAEEGSLGTIADNARMVASGVGQFFVMLCFICGLCFIIAAWFQYDNYKKNMGQVRLSVPAFLLFFGCIFMIIPLVAWLSPSSETVDS